MEHDGDKRMNVWKRESEKIGHDRNAGSNADGAVAVSLKFHLEHPRTCCLAGLDGGPGLLSVRELRRRRRPEDDRPIRARSGRFRRHRVRYGIASRSCPFRADTAADTDDDKRELRPTKKKKGKRKIMIS
jgi:hypothetical protein